MVRKEASIIILTRCVCETQMPPIMANSKDGQGHKDKYLDTSRIIVSEEMLMCNMKALDSTHYLKVINKVKVFKT